MFTLAAYVNGLLMLIYLYLISLSLSLSLPSIYLAYKQI